MTPLNWTMMATHVPPGGSLGGIVRYTVELMTALNARQDVVVSAVTTTAAADTIADLLGDRDRVSTVPNLPVAPLSIVERYVPLPGLRPSSGGPADVVQGIKHIVPRHSKALRILTVHDLLLLDRPDDFGWAKRQLLPPFYRGSIRDADFLLCVSEATKARLRAHDPATVDRSVVVHPAVPSPLLNATPKPISALIGRQFGIVVGDPSPRKNLWTVISAWAKVRAQVPGAVLAVAGPPSWGRTELGAAYQTLVDDGSVLPLGYVDDDELRWAYENAAIAFCPSLAEGFGLPAVETLAFGCPVLISEDAALQEAAAGRARGVIPAGDTDAWAAAAIDALHDPRRRTTEPNGLVRTWAEVAEDTVAAVRQAIERRQQAVASR